jgi:hypothetical protein
MHLYNYTLMHMIALILLDHFRKTKEVQENFSLGSGAEGLS